MNIPAENWTVGAVCEYLNTLELGEYTFKEHVESFRSEIINGKLFLNLKKNDLNVLGVIQFAKRNQLYQHIQQLKAAAVQPQRQETNSLHQTEPEVIITSPPHIEQASHDQNQTQTDSYLLNKLNWNHDGLIKQVSPAAIMPQPPLRPAPAAALNICSFLHPINTEDHFSFQSLHASVPQASSPMSQILPAPFSTPTFSLDGALELNIPMPSNILTPANMASNTQYSPNASVASTSVDVLANAVSDLNLNKPQQKTNNRVVHEIMGIHYGMNTQNHLFILMTKTAISTLNKLYQEHNIMDSYGGGIKRRVVSHPLQTFESADNLVTGKIQHGWTVRNDETHTEYRLPFHALCTFTVDLVSNQVTHICPVIVNGKVNQMNKFKAAWIISDVQIKAIEEVPHFGDANAANDNKKLLVANIVYVDIANVSDVSLQHRDSSYMLHDPEHLDILHQLHKGMAVQCCLKLSTRTNRKHSCRQKPVYVQVWNVKPWTRAK